MSQEITHELLDQFLGKEVYADFNTFDVFHAKLTKPSKYLLSFRNGYFPPLEFELKDVAWGVVENSTLVISIRG